MNIIERPLNNLEWVDRNKLVPNDYNPNKVSKENLELLTKSIIVNGWTLPIVVRHDYVIIDGFHRWTVSGPDWKYIPKFKKEEIEDLNMPEEIIGKTLFEILNGKVPVVISTKHKSETGYIYGTVTHNRARGVHMLEPMKCIVKRLMENGKTISEISNHFGMKPEEIFRLSDFSREDFLKMMIKDNNYSKAEIITKL